MDHQRRHHEGSRGRCRRLDYCNSLLYRTSTVNINMLQRVQHSGARTVAKSSRFGRITPVLAELHWLPIQYQIQFKIAVTTFKVLTTQEPNYLTKLIRFHIPTRQLRSSGRNQLHVDRVNIAFAERAFCHDASTVWNNLPQIPTSNLSSLITFKRLLKT